MESPPGKFIFLDIDIGGSREAYARAAAFVEANDIKYNFSSKNIAELGGRELLSVQDMYSSDFDWSSGGAIATAPQPCCRVVIRLFEEECPLTCENFEALVTGRCGRAKGSGVPLHYRGAVFHRIVPGFIAQGGDYVMHNGSGGESIWGKKFKDEKNGLKLKHSKAGIVSMCNSGKNSNGSQFFFTFRACPQLDGKHVVFGEVAHGMEVLELMQAVPCVDGEPQRRVAITECGLWRNPADPNSMPTQGYWSPSGAFVETAAPSAAEGGAGRLGGRSVIVVATKTAVSERFGAVLSGAGVGHECVAAFEAVAGRLGAAGGGGGPAVLVAAPGEGPALRGALQGLCAQGGGHVFICCKPAELMAAIEQHCQ